MTTASSSVSFINSLLVFWKRFLYWSTSEGLVKMEFIIAGSVCTTLVGKSEQCQEPFINTDRASAGEMFYLFSVPPPVLSRSELQGDAVHALPLVVFVVGV
jgi:hypothetical protein